VDEIKKVSLVIPLFNEEELVVALAERVTQALASEPDQFEIIIVDDGSSDQTRQRLAAWQGNDSRVVVVELSRNWGHQNAFNAGIDVASGDAVILMDGDLEDPPEFISQLLRKWREGYEVVSTTKNSRIQKPLLRLLTSAYYKLLTLVVDAPTQYQSGMFSLLDRTAADALRGMRERNKSYPNLRALIGFRRITVPYDRAPRAAGSPKQSLRRLIKDGLNAIFSNTYFPIRVFTIFGLFFSILFFAVGIAVFWVRLTGIEFWVFRNIPGTQLILLSVLGFGALQILFLGVIGEYIARIYDEAKRRPSYLIRNIKRVDSSLHDPQPFPTEERKEQSETETVRGPR
jgi:polyisoprenyl-phosphate glycosyltransferase